MKSSHTGARTSNIEVLNVSLSGIWLLVKDTEYFLPYKEFPWFKDARITDVHHVQLLRDHHLRWDKLDVDLELDSLKHVEQYPLKYR